MIMKNGISVIQERDVEVVNFIQDHKIFDSYTASKAMYMVNSAKHTVMKYADDKQIMNFENLKYLSEVCEELMVVCNEVMVGKCKRAPHFPEYPFREFQYDVLNSASFFYGKMIKAAKTKHAKKQIPELFEKSFIVNGKTLALLRKKLSKSKIDHLAKREIDENFIIKTMSISAYERAKLIDELHSNNLEWTEAAYEYSQKYFERVFDRRPRKDVFDALKRMVYSSLDMYETLGSIDRAKESVTLMGLLLDMDSSVKDSGFKLDFKEHSEIEKKTKDIGNVLYRTLSKDQVDKFLSNDIYKRLGIVDESL
jgi:hypothetical protein